MMDLVTLASVFMLVVSAFVVLHATMGDRRSSPPVNDFPSYPPYAY